MSRKLFPNHVEPMAVKHGFGPFACAAVISVLSGGLTGCPQFRDPNVPAPILERVEPITGKEYLLYAPSNYDRTKRWPLLVACHGTRPWDRPRRLIQDWVRLAEEEGFIVVAPELQGTRGDFPPKPEIQFERQREDEELILNVVQHVKGAYSISDDRVFLTGWSAGSYAVLFTGLRHPDIFRALAVLKGNFDPAYLAPVVDRIDPHQPVYVLYSPTDVITGTQGPESVEWLLEHGANVTAERSGRQHAHAPKSAFDFFEFVLAEVPWFRIRVVQTELQNPWTYLFTAVGSFDPQQYLWDFGDGTDSPVASPQHTYKESGTYRVQLRAMHPRRGEEVVRSVTLTVP